MIFKRILTQSIKCASLVLALGMCAGLFCGCGSKEKVTLSVWCGEEDLEMVQGMLDEFKESYADKAEIDFTLSMESEVSCKQTVLSNPSAAADVFVFAGDQLRELHQAGALLEITEHTDQIIAANGGADSGAIKCASPDGKLYAYPLTASNGYFLYYNSNYLTEEDVKSFDRILEVAASNNQKIAMDLSSGWYLFSFFKGAGLEVGLNEDGISNYCNWNTTEGPHTGKDVAEAILAISTHDGFISCTDSEFVDGAKAGTIIAGINGAWNSPNIEAAYGDGYAATKLPEYTVAGDQVQMCSFAGYKMMGISAYTKSPAWAMRLAEFMTNEEHQLERFRLRGEAPSNVNAAASKEVLASPAIAALQAQSLYGYPENIAGEYYWTPTNVFGLVLAAKNPDNIDLQMLLDTLQKDITTSPPPAIE